MNSKDWHRADIIAALKKKGLSISELSRCSGYATTTLSNVLVRPWTRGEQIVADVLETSPETIWPSRYKNQTRVVRSKYKQP